MNKFLKSSVSFLIVVIISFSAMVYPVKADAEYTEAQMNAVALLNYLGYISYDISEAANNRLYLDEIYDKLINNTNPRIVDKNTQSELASLLDVIQNHKMIDVKRERIKYIYELNQSGAIRDALPDPRSVMNVVLSSKNYVQLALSVGYLALDSWTSYKNSISESEKEFFEANTTLDDEEAKEFHNRRISIFMYMIDMCNDYDINTSLNEAQIGKFIEIKNEKNVTNRIKQLQSKREEYRTFGPYWLVLAESCFEAENYKECVDAIEEYRKLNIDIFRKDYDYANVLPMAMAAEKWLYEEKSVSKDEYEQYILTGCLEIEENTVAEDWSLRYFIAQSYVDLFNLTNDESHLYKAYQLLLRNNIIPC